MGLSTRPLNLWPRRRQRTRPRRASLRPVQRRGSQWPSSHMASVQGSRTGPELPSSSAACGSTDAAPSRKGDQASVAARPAGHGSPARRPWVSDPSPTRSRPTHRAARRPLPQQRPPGSSPRGAGYGSPRPPVHALPSCGPSREAESPGPAWGPLLRTTRACAGSHSQFRYSRDPEALT